MYWIIAGEHEKTFSLGHATRGGHDVCCSCSPDYIFVSNISFASVEIYSWTGHHIKTLSEQQLDIGKEYHIRDIQCNHNGTVLQLVIGGGHGVHSLHAHKVRSTML